MNLILGNNELNNIVNKARLRKLRWLWDKGTIKSSLPSIGYLNIHGNSALVHDDAFLLAVTLVYRKVAVWMAGQMVSATQSCLRKNLLSNVSPAHRNTTFEETILKRYICVPIRQKAST